MQKKGSDNNCEVNLYWSGPRFLWEIVLVNTEDSDKSSSLIFTVQKNGNSSEQPYLNILPPNPLPQEYENSISSKDANV